MPGFEGVWSRHIAKRIPAKRRARATVAMRRPRRLASCSAGLGNRCTTGLVAAVSTIAASATARCAVNCSHTASRGPERGRQLGRKRELLHVDAEPVGIPGTDPQPLTAHERPHQGDGPAPRAHEQVPHAELTAHLALFRGHPVRRTRGPDPARLGQHPGIAPVGLHASAPFRIHRRVIRVCHDHLMPAGLERLRHPFAFGRRLEQHPRPRAGGEHGGEAVPRALDPLLDDFAFRRGDADLTFPLVDVDANMLHGWPLFLRFERVT